MRTLIFAFFFLAWFTTMAQHHTAITDRFVRVEALDFLEDVKGDQPVLVIFLGTDCPISQKYVHTLRELYANYQDDIRFFGIIPQTFSDEKIRTFKISYGIPFELIKDKGNDIAHTFGATITPEVFLFDGNGKLYYDGAIDNWFFALGKNRRTPTEHYLKDAITDMQAGQLIRNAHTEAIGCFIEMNVNDH